MPAMPIREFKEWDGLKTGVTCPLIYFPFMPLELFWFILLRREFVCVCLGVHLRWRMGVGVERGD